MRFDFKLGNRLWACHSAGIFLLAGDAAERLKTFLQMTT
jgi:hypothetical protein